MKKAMWKLEELQNDQCYANINGKWVPARPLNYKREWCGLFRRVCYAWMVLIGKHETFEWPENQ